MLLLIDLDVLLTAHVLCVAMNDIPWLQLGAFVHH